MAPSSPNVSAPSSASTLPRSQTSSATPRSPPDWRSTAPGTVKIPEPIVVPTGPARVKVGARSEAEPAHEPGAQVRENVSVEIVGDDHLEPLRLAHQLHR